MKVWSCQDRLIFISLSKALVKWEVNEKYKVKWTMDKVENSDRSARMQKLCN